MVNLIKIDVRLLTKGRHKVIKTYYITLDHNYQVFLVCRKPRRFYVVKYKGSRIWLGKTIKEAKTVISQHQIIAGDGGKEKDK